MGSAGSTYVARPILHSLQLWVTPRRIHPVAAIGAGKATGLAGADYCQGEHIIHSQQGEFAEGEGRRGSSAAIWALRTKCWSRFWPKSPTASAASVSS